MRHSRLRMAMLLMPGLLIAIAGVITLSGDSVMSRFREAVNPAPRTLTYQGYLVEANGSPVNSASQSITFRLYSSATGGTSLWQETHTVAVTDGLFSVELGATSSLKTVLERSPLYLGIRVGTGTELSPRQELTSVPFAVRSSDSDALGGLPASSYVTRGQQGDPCDLELRLNQRFYDFALSEECAPPTTRFTGDNGEQQFIVDIAENAKGNPVALVRRFPGSTLGIVNCDDIRCSDYSYIELTDTALKPTAPIYVITEGSIALGADGFPIVSYNDVTETGLFLIKCAREDCKEYKRIAVDNQDGRFYGSSSIIVGQDGNPFIAYNSSNGLTLNGGFQSSLRTAHCPDSECSRPVITEHQTAGFSGGPVFWSAGTGQLPRAAIGVEGLPHIAYRWGLNQRVMMAKCRNIACTESELQDLRLDVGDGVGIAMIGKDTPVVVHNRAIGTTGDSIASVVLCSDAKCTDTEFENVTYPVQGAPAAASRNGHWPEVEVIAGRAPAFSYWQDSVGLVYSRCVDETCSEVVGMVVIHDPGFTGSNYPPTNLLITSKDEIIITDDANFVYCTEVCP